MGSLEMTATIEYSDKPSASTHVAYDFIEDRILMIVTTSNGGMLTYRHQLLVHDDICDFWVSIEYMHRYCILLGEL